MQSPDAKHQRLDDDRFREALRGVVRRSGRSMRALSLAMGRDPGYVAALLDPTRPSRARPTPADLVDLSDATGIPLVELFDTLWAIPVDRIMGEVSRHGCGERSDVSPEGLSSMDRRTIADLTDFLAARRTPVRAVRRGR